MRPFRVSGCPEIQQSRESPSVGHHRSYQTSRAVNLWLLEEFQPTPTNVYLQLFPHIAIKIPLSSQEATWRDRFRFNWQGPIDGLTEERRESRIKEERPRHLLLMFLNQINYKTIPKWSYSMKNGGLNNLLCPIGRKDNLRIIYINYLFFCFFVHFFKSLYMHILLK